MRGWAARIADTLRGESQGDSQWVSEEAQRPTARRRAVIALAIGCASALFTWAVTRPAAAIPDFPAWWTAARLLIAGGNPYHALPGTPPWPFSDRLYYPMPAVLVTLPVAWLPMPAAAGLVMGSSSALLAWCLTRDGLGRLWLFASPAYVLALKLGQWSPLVTTAAFLPAMGWAAAVKPSLGLAVLAYRPTVRGIALAIALTLLGFALLPSWLSDWRANLAFLERHPAPVATLGGPLLLLALARWRRPDARLLIVLACVPQLLLFADQLPLWLTPRTRREMMLLTACSSAGFGLWLVSLRPGTLYVAAAAPFVMASCYLPALLIVLRHRNAGRLSGTG